MHALRSPIAIFRRIAALARRPVFQAVTFYILARLISMDVFLAVARQLRGVRMMSGGAFRLWEPALLRWDAVYYASIAQIGYPARLPVGPDGQVMPNTWAFFPAFPAAAAAATRITGLPFVWTAMALNLVAGAVVAGSLAALVRPVAGDRVAIRAATLWAFLPTAFLLHLPYSEPLHLGFAAACLVAVVRGRTILAALLLVGAALSRGAALPLAAAVAARVVIDLRLAWAGRSTAMPRHTPWLRAAVVLVVAVVAPWAWMLVAWQLTGRLDAVAASQGAWGIRADPAALVAAWRAAIGHDGLSLLLNPSVIVLACVAGLTVGCLGQSRIPLELKIYTVVATSLVFAVAQPGAVAFGSVPRFAFAILTLPIVLAIWLRRSWPVGLVVIGCTWLQYLWVLNVWSGRIGVAP
ncbi:MAG: hypothetical protein ABI634_09305 [Acidobacteriota bacterium]